MVMIVSSCEVFDERARHPRIGAGIRDGGVSVV
jgi:hypothetical protein